MLTDSCLPSFQLAVQLGAETPFGKNQEERGDLHRGHSQEPPGAAQQAADQAAAQDQGHYRRNGRHQVHVEEQRSQCAHAGQQHFRQVVVFGVSPLLDSVRVSRGQAFLPLVCKQSLPAQSRINTDSRMTNQVSYHTQIQFRIPLRTLVHPPHILHAVVCLQALEQGQLRGLEQLLNVRNL